MDIQPGWSDDPINQPDADSLNRISLATETAQLIDQVTESRGSKVFGLTGPWGSGKTSLALIIADRLKHASSAWKIAQFTPWAATDTGTMMAEFITSLADILPNNARKNMLAIIGKSIALTAPVVAPMISTMTGIAPASINTSATKLGEWFTKKDSWEKTFKNLSDELEKSDEKVLILVDDIDRLDQPQLALLLKIIRLLGRFPGIHYLLMYDEVTLFETLSGARDDPSAVRYANRYMEKIVQYQIPVPPMSQYQIAQRVLEGLKKVEERAGRTWNLDSSALRPVLDILPAAFSTPRGIDRYLVQLERVLRLHSPAEIDDAALMLLTVLQTEEPTVYSRLPQLKQLLTRDRKNLLSLDSREEKEIDWQKILGASSPWEGTLTKAIVNTLFPATLPKNWMASYASHNSVRHSDYFDRYFVHTIHGYDVRDSDLDAAISALQRRGDPCALVDLFQSGLTQEQMWMALGRLQERSIPKTSGRQSVTSVALVEAISRLLKVLPGDPHDLISPRDRGHFWLREALEHIDPEASPMALERALDHVWDLSDRAEALTKALRFVREEQPSSDPLREERVALLSETGLRYTEILTDLLFALLARQRNTMIFDHRLANTVYMLSYIGDAQRFQQRMNEDGDEIPSWAEIVACCVNVGLSSAADRKSILGINEENLRRLCPDIDLNHVSADQSSMDVYDITWGNVLTFAQLSMGEGPDRD